MSDNELTALQEEIKTVFSRFKRPKKALITAGMPYANGPVHIGHLAGAHVPADIYARYMRMMIGNENVLFVNGTDDHGSNSEVAAKTKGISTKEFIDSIHDSQKKTMERYSISLDTYTGTSREETYESHKNYCQDILRKLHENNMLEKKTTEQWFDTKLNMFLPDRFVFGTCPNEKCENEKAYSEECDVCGSHYDPKELQNPKSTVSDATPVLKETDHWWLDMWKVSDQLCEWIQSRQKFWRKNVYLETINTALPSFGFSNKDEETFKDLKEQLPKHKSRYAPGKRIVAQFDNLSDLESSKKILEDAGIKCDLEDGWAHRSITRDVSWGIPVPEDIDKDMAGKTFYVWPESLVAPIGFTMTALKQKGMDPNLWKDYWTDPESNVYQFLGQDNIFFYVLMQGAMWFGTQADVFRQPIAGELQMTDIFANYHLQIDGQKMSKSVGNFYTGDQLIEEMGYDSDQIRYFLAILSLPEKNSNFDFENFKERNAFLAGPMNASFEKPISACHKQFNGKVPEGKLVGKTRKETYKIIQNYLRMMEKGDYAKILFAIENYARIINGLFTQFKPHDDRFDEEQRRDALFSCFFILKNTMIMLQPFAPKTMDKLRQSMNLPESVFSLDELCKPIQAGHQIGEQAEFFPTVENE